MNREEILAVRDRELVDVQVWGGTVKVRSLSVREQLDMEAKIKLLHEAKDVRSATALQLASYICNEDGTPMFDPDTAQSLLDRKPMAIKAILDAAQKLNGWTSDAEEEIRKNS